MTRKRRTLADLLGARSQLLPDPAADVNGDTVPTFIRDPGGCFSSELYACERHHGRRLLDDDRPALDEFLEARRVELGLARLPQTTSMCPGDVTPPTYPVPDAEPAPAPR